MVVNNVVTSVFSRSDRAHDELGAEDEGGESAGEKGKEDKKVSAKVRPVSPPQGRTSGLLATKASGKIVNFPGRAVALNDHIIVCT